jgi:hypothetical protein
MSVLTIDTACCGHISLKLKRGDAIHYDEYAYIRLVDLDRPTRKSMKLKIDRCDLVKLRNMIDYALDEANYKGPTLELADTN